MAKQPVVTRDRFRIFCETEAADMGTVIGQLTRMGFQNIGFELITDVRTFGTNGPRVVHETSATEFAIEWIKDHASFKASELAEHFKENGRAANTAYYSLKRLKERELIVSLDSGNYQRADVKAIAAPKSEAATEDQPARTRKAPKPKYYEVSNHDLIWRHVKNRKKFTSNDIAVLFRAHKRPTKSASSQLTQMTAAGVFKRVGEGEYIVVKKKKPAKKPVNKQNTPIPHVNGAGTPAEENANG